VYARRIDDKELTFGVSGSLIRNNLVMYDHQTDSLWSQLLGMAIEGQMKGTRLEHLPSQLTTWEQWVEVFPDTLVLDKRGRYDFDPYFGYYVDSSRGVTGSTVKDDRLPAKEIVFGVAANNKGKAYKINALEKQNVVNDTLGGEPVVVAYDPKTSTAAAFSRRVGSRTLTFLPGLATSEGFGPPLLRDKETNSLWTITTGSAIDGPMSGSALKVLPSSYSFWFAWVDFYADSPIFSLE
jgi:hypothetical protein